MVRKGDGNKIGSSRRMSKDRRVGADRRPDAVKFGGEKVCVVEGGGSFDQAVKPLEKVLFSGQGERQSVPSPQTHHRQLVQNDNEDQVADSFKGLQLRDGGTAESLDSDRRGSLELANGEMGSGVRVGGRLENEEEMGVKRLLRLGSSAGSLQLSDVKLMHNKQQQEDEVLVLKSIYQNDFVPVDEGEGGMAAFMINLHVEVQEGLPIVAEAPRSYDSGEERSVASISGSTLSHSNQHSFTVQALPPICLLCVLPPTYPSHSPPLFMLSCLWMNSKKLASLCMELDKAWEDTSPEVVVYTWAEWLKCESLSHLGESEKLELGPYSENERGKSITEEFDERGISASTSFDVDIPRLLRFNEEMRNKQFLESLHLCKICFSEQPGTTFARLPCQHKFCWTCMQQYSDMHVKEGSVVKLICPETSCKESIPPTLLKELLGKEAFQRWEELLLQKTLDSMADVVYCPRCESVTIEDEDHHVLCSKCFFSFCSLCMSQWHGGQTCMTAEAKLRILQGRQKGRAVGEEARKKEQALINEVLNLKYITKEAKQCPTCKMAVQKSEGCNKMTCTNCGDCFCFKCGRAITGYEHFRDGSCILFDQEEIDQWEVRFQREQHQYQQPEVNRVAGLLGGQHVGLRPCPNCRQPNWKEGNNNHIFCWACQNHYCALCNRMVRRSAEHYGPNKCRQHTAD